MRGCFVTSCLQMPLQSKVSVLVAVLCVASLSEAAIGAAGGGNGSGGGHQTGGNAFKECLVNQPHVSLGYCLGFGAIAKLQSFDSSPEFDLVDGLTFSRDEKMYREQGYSVLPETNPNDLRSIVDSWGQVFASRSMKWDMGFVYPGLAMKISPSPVTGGVLEFVMDNPFAQHSLKEASTGRILARQFLVPLLLGFKFNVATLIPIVFGAIALIAKKALILSKIALVVSSAFGLSSLLFASQPFSHSYGYQPTFNPGFGGGGGGGASGHHHPHPYRFSEEEAAYQETYRSNANIYNEDQLRLYDAELQQAFSPGSAGSRVDLQKKEGRNFAWSEAEKKKKQI